MERYITEESMSEIKYLMERSRRFISLGGLSSVLDDIYALLRVFASYSYMYSNNPAGRGGHGSTGTDVNFLIYCYCSCDHRSQPGSRNRYIPLSHAKAGI